MSRPGRPDWEFHQSAIPRLKKTLRDGYPNHVEISWFKLRIAAKIQTYAEERDKPEVHFAVLHWSSFFAHILIGRNELSLITGRS